MMSYKLLQGHFTNSLLPVTHQGMTVEKVLELLSEPDCVMRGCKAEVFTSRMFKEALACVECCYRISHVLYTRSPHIYPANNGINELEDCVIDKSLLYEKSSLPVWPMFIAKLSVYTSIGCRAFSYAAHQIWNDIPLWISRTFHHQSVDSNVTYNHVIFPLHFNPAMCHQWLSAPPIPPNDRHCVRYICILHCTIAAHD